MLSVGGVDMTKTNPFQRYDWYKDLTKQLAFADQLTQMETQAIEKWADENGFDIEYFQDECILSPKVTK
jgi:hypothetical protein